ncbi:hypothetical protein BC830DRAFT_1139543 [Chytriomyces sp. MP71]|nr:hypothetical protein BC830DRAFT_1139543 [Chytriomyces sp. MP71]
MFKKFFGRRRASNATASGSTEDLTLSSSSSLSVSGSTISPSTNVPSPRSSATPSPPTPTQPTPPRPRILTNSAQVVVLSNGELTSLVPLLTALALNNRSTPSPTYAIDRADDLTPCTPSPLLAPAAEPDALTNFNTTLVSPLRKYATSLLHLPAELQIQIAHRAGFRAAICLMRTCTRLRDILEAPEAWYEYTARADCSSDILETHITITTQIHTFDHLVFGLWDTGDGGGDPSVFFEHNAFSEEFDFLGGVAVSMSRAGAVRSEFFEHREGLRCYRAALETAVVSGALPPSAPFGGPPVGARIDHSCAECTRYDARRILKSIFVFDQLPTNPRWGREGFSWTYDYPDGRRRLTIRIAPFQGALGYTSVRDLPSVYVQKVNLNGEPMEGEEWDQFQRLVQRKWGK